MRTGRPMSAELTNLVWLITGGVFALLIVFAIGVAGLWWFRR